MLSDYFVDISPVFLMDGWQEVWLLSFILRVAVWHGYCWLDCNEAGIISWVWRVLALKDHLFVDRCIIRVVFAHFDLFFGHFLVLKDGTYLVSLELHIWLLLVDFVAFTVLVTRLRLLMSEKGSQHPLINFIRTFEQLTGHLVQNLLPFRSDRFCRSTVGLARGGIIWGILPRYGTSVTIDRWAANPGSDKRLPTG